MFSLGIPASDLLIIAALALPATSNSYPGAKYASFSQYLHQRNCELIVTYYSNRAHHQAERCFFVRCCVVHVKFVYRVGRIWLGYGKFVNNGCQKFSDVGISSERRRPRSSPWLTKSGKGRRRVPAVGGGVLILQVSCASTSSRLLPRASRPARPRTRLRPALR